MNCAIDDNTTPGPHGWGQKSKIGADFQKYSSLLPYMLKKTKCIIIVSMKPSIKNVKFNLLAHGSGVEALGESQYCHILKCIKNL